VLPANLCPLIKSSYGYAATETCPYFMASDILIGETTCDGKKKMFELLRRMKPLFLMQLPYTLNREATLRYWHEEILRLKVFLEEHTGIPVEAAELKRQIRIQNRVRRLLDKVSRTCADWVVPVSGLDMMVVMETKSFSVDLESYSEKLEEFALELETLMGEGESVCSPDAPRILLTGCPAGKGSDKVLRIIEECGGIIVCQENCTGVKSLDILVDEDEEDPFLAIAQRYLLIPCSCMTPNRGRLDLLGRLVREYRIHGVVDLTWQCCHTYNVESYVVKEYLEQEYGLPVLHIDTDYSSSDTEQLRTRIEAFVEMLG
jgi:benzoyl-CoA reductase/2-hydroxyglutaryl-CoA dehydratase subunit BcrC/BadD/HgdB